MGSKTAMTYLLPAHCPPPPRPFSLAGLRQAILLCIIAHLKRIAEARVRAERRRLRTSHEIVALPTFSFLLALMPPPETALVLT
jgi:hypothetical protein